MKPEVRSQPAASTEVSVIVQGNYLIRLPLIVTFCSYKAYSLLSLVVFALSYLMELLDVSSRMCVRVFVAFGSCY